MSRSGEFFGRIRSSVAAGFAALALIAAAAPSPADARVFVSVGVPFPGFAPFPYYPYPPVFYPPPPPAYYPGYAAPAAVPSPVAAPTPAAITYTERPAFRNAAGQTCREYRSSTGAFGTACQDAGGQWRVAN